ncbi:MAG: hypothetical protein U5R48_01970 [Gammaproteobacteria bacterium]|nr:hypothetical protein [Gammaproteobacteria bacterium]
MNRAPAPCLRILAAVCLLVAGAGGALLAPVPASASEAPVKVERDYPDYPPAPANQHPSAAEEKSAGCMSCHTDTDSKTMHANPGVVLGCTDCHGGDASVFASGDEEKWSDAYYAVFERAHVLPEYPEDWHYPGSANPKRSYTLLNRESPEFVRFVNPSDYRIVEEACGACHMETIQAAKRSIMATGAMLFGGAAYNNGILPFKNYILGEGYTRDGTGAVVKGPPLKNPEEARREHGVMPQLAPLPAWETVKPGDIFRVFERGGRIILNLFPETGLPNSLGLIQRLEEPGRPDIRQSIRGPGTGQRISVPLINLTKTRLNDPLMWFLGTNEQPGDFRTSGCGACHVVYANDRDPRHSGKWAEHGHMGRTATVDPTIPRDEPGHPIRHEFTRSIPTSQCMSCHMHQPNMFVNTYLGYTMWDYESDAPEHWPEDQVYPTSSEIREVNARNPEGAAVRGKWADVDYLREVWERNDEYENTQFADYHGHGWLFRAVFKKDRKGNLLDAEGDKISHDDPDKFDKAVHMSSVHLDAGMHCVDCHFAQDSHGNGHIYTEVANAVEIDCVDCHGTADEYPNLVTSGPAAPPRGHDLRLLRNPDGQQRFEWVDGELIQRSLLDPELEWEMSLVKDSVTPGNDEYNAKSARAKLMSRDTDSQHWGTDVAPEERAHSNDDLECYTCHTSWTTSCGGCHLPIEANWKTERKHYEGGITRNYATYNPQVVRDQVFMIGRRGGINGGRIAPLRSSSALVLSSTNANREKIYIQQPPIAASGYSSQAINPHFPHTVRKTETKTCSDCHLSAAGDNNAIMAQTLGLGTDYIDFLGHYAYLGTGAGVEAVKVTEWDEPQAVIGSFLHRYAYPDWFAEHQERDLELTDHHYNDAPDGIRCLQNRGEYLYTASGRDGFRVYDIASIANKGFSYRIITAPFSEIGHDTQVEMSDATCLSLVTTQPVAPERNQGELMRVENQEQPHHPIYNYAFVTDAEEGLVLVDINTLADGEPRNNFLERALTWNEDGILDGARHITMGGHYAYIAADAGLVILDLDDPMEPQLTRVVPMEDPRASHQQFRYLWVTDAEGLKVVDVTDPAKARVVPDNTIELDDARGIFVTRTWVYVAAGGEGLVVVDALKPEAMTEYRRIGPEQGVTDARDVTIAHTNASLFAYVADGRDGLKVLQLTAPDTVPGFYGFSPDPEPELIARFDTRGPALALPRPLERDRAVDETGHQIAVFGRLGSGPLSSEDMRGLYMNEDGSLWFVRDDPDGGAADSSVTRADGESESDSDGNSEAPAAHTAGERDHDSGQAQGVGGG